MQHKIIGITPRILFEGDVQKEFVNSNYLDYLQDKNFIFIMLTLENNKIEELLSLCDGFLITGGYDLNPNIYDEENNGSNNICDELDTIDSYVVNHAYVNKKPLLGICRGLQSINVFLGGNLIQDLGDTHPSKRQHIVKIKKGKYFEKDINILTNSYHHQAVQDLGHDLEVFAITEDGIIEGFYHRTRPIIAVQWHPEISRTGFDEKIANIFKKMF